MEFIVATTIIVAGTLWVGLLLAVPLGKIIVSLLPGQTTNLKKWMKGAVEADALVLEAEDTGFLINSLPQTRIQIQVRPDKGRNFVAEIKQVLSEADAAILKAGSTIRVKYNPHNYKELILIKET